MPKTTLKVAVQLFGHLRTFEACAPRLYENLLSKYDCDIFVHTWSMLNHSTKTWHANSCGLQIKTQESKLRNSYRDIKALIIDEQVVKDYGEALFKPHHNAPALPISIFGIGSMLYSMGQANRLREEYEQTRQITYDLVISIRPDVLLKVEIEIEELLASLDPDRVENAFFTFASAGTRLFRDFGSLAATDVLFFGKPCVISSVIKRIPDVRDLFQPGLVYRDRPEYEIIKIVNALGYAPYRVDYQYGKDWEILRAQGGNGLARLILRKRFFLMWLLPAISQNLFDLTVELKFYRLGGGKLNLSLGNPGRTHISGTVLLSDNDPVPRGQYPR